MPYITEKRRTEVRLQFPCDRAQTAGELNYQITKLVGDYIVRSGKSYASMNEAIGALECVKLEFYRRIAAPYEEIKLVQNGDVYS